MTSKRRTLANPRAFGKGTKHCQAYASPPISSPGEPVPSSATVTLTNTSGMAFNSVSLSQGTNGDAAKATEYDEFRFGGSFASVVTGP